MGSHSAFFYGTLMAPQVLHRVCHGSSSADNPLYKLHQLRASPAVLPGFRRHRVRHADYPAVVPCEGASVRGTLVTGLTDADIWRLDIFEGDEYRRVPVRARVLTAVGDDDATGRGNVEADEPVDAETYVWEAGAELLEDGEWDFAEFQREKMRFWVGVEGMKDDHAGRASIIEVDQAVAGQQQRQELKDGTGGRGVNGHITHALNEQSNKDEVLKSAV